jgi:hypothetical protein
MGLFRQNLPATLVLGFVLPLRSTARKHPRICRLDQIVKELELLSQRGTIKFRLFLSFLDTALPIWSITLRQTSIRHPS